RLEEAASARAEEAHRDVVAQKRKAVAARSENAELVRAQREACERRAAELRKEQRALELLEADGRQLIADANIARGQRERVYRHAAARVCERREAREEAERRVRAVRGEGHATVRMAESVLSAEGRSMRPVPLLRDPVEVQRVTDKRAERAARDAEALRKVSASDMATIKAVAKSRVRKVVHDAFPVKGEVPGLLSAEMKEAAQMSNNARVLVQQDPTLSFEQALKVLAATRRSRTEHRGKRKAWDSGSVDGRAPGGGGTRGSPGHQSGQGRGRNQGRGGQGPRGDGSASSGSQSGRGSGSSWKKRGGG
ncbi:unnamed protein product, partial [Ectocarpus sp. 13 AM-2016]